MKLNLYPGIILYAIIPALISCSQNKETVSESPREEAPEINTSLTEEEKSGGVMTPEIMWKFGRMGSIALSPDGSTVLYTVTSYDLLTEARITNITVFHRVVASL